MKRTALIFVVVLLVELPFLVSLNQGPHSEWGWIGYMFFAPSLMLFAWLAPDYSLRGGQLIAFECALVLVQAVLLTTVVVLILKLSARRRVQH